MSDIHFSADIDLTQLEAGVRQANKTVGAWVSDVEKQTNSIDKSMQRVGVMIASYFSARALAGFGREIIEVRGQFQQLSIAFETMLGNKEKADRLMQEAITFAAKTPFTLADVATNIKQLMAMGIATDKVMETMKSLGDVAAGVSVPIARVAINYGQVSTMGKLQGRELRDFNMAGIPLADELAKILGKQKDEIAGMVEAGQIGFPLVEQAFKSMSSEGGKFYNLMEKQNLSVTGQISNLTDKWQLMLNNIGKSNEGLIYSGIGGVSSLIKNYENVIEVLKGLALVLGAVKVATMYVAYEQKVMAEATALATLTNNLLTASELKQEAAANLARKSQERLNASMLTNPYVLAAAAIAAVGFAIYKLATYETDLEKAINKTDIEIENEKDKALDLFSALKAAKEGTDKWRDARKNIIDQYGSLIPAEIQEFKNLTDIKTAQDLVNQSLIENIAIRTKADTIQDIGNKYNPQIVESQKEIVSAVESKLGKERAAMVKQEIAGLVAAYKAELPGAEKALIDYRQKLMSEVGKVNKQGLANSISAANMAGTFAPLLGALENIKSETNLANEAFKKYSITIKQDTPATPAEVKLTTATEQRLELQKQLIIEEKKLKDLETKPGVNPLKDIDEQEAVVKAIKEQLKQKEKVLTLDEKIKEQETLLDKAIEAGNEKQMKAIAKRISELQKELELREKIAGFLVEQVDYSGFVPTKIGGMKTSSVLPETKKPTTQKLWEDLKKEMTTLRPISQKLLDAGKEADEKAIESQKLKIENQRQLIAGASELVYMAGKQLGLSDEELKILDEKLQVIGQFTSGNYVAAAVTAVISVVSSFMALVPNQFAKLDTQIERINQLLTEQQRIIDLSQRKGGQESARKKELDLLKQQLAAQEAKLKKAQNILDPEYFMWVRTNGMMKKAEKTVKEMTAAVKETKNAIDDADLALTDFMVGGITENTIADSIAQGFRDGKTSVDDFGDYMNTVLLDAVMNIFKGQLLSSPEMKKFTDDLKTFMEDQVLTPEEVEKLKADQMSIVTANKQGFDALTGGLNLTGSVNAGLSGQISRSITEETGTELAGLFRRYADENRQIRDYSKIGVDRLVGIEANTAQTVDQLKLAVVELKSISTNTKPAFTGAL